MFTDDQLLPISALQHLLFCERQCALIHLEQLWAENRLTVEGQVLHRKTHEGPATSRDGVRTARALSLCSYEFGLIGKSDVVEFEPPAAQKDERDLTLMQLLDRDRTSGRIKDWRVTPVEYKRGKAKRDASDVVQLCAQALCLEEMLGVVIPGGAMFYGTPRRRMEILFDEALRTQTIQTIERLHAMIASGCTPPAKREPKCRSCSLLHLCLPDALAPRRSPTAYMQHMLAS